MKLLVLSRVGLRGASQWRIIKAVVAGEWSSQYIFVQDTVMYAKALGNNHIIL